MNRHNYKYDNFKPVHWESIGQFFLDFFGDEYHLMFELILEIQASELKDLIVGITSMNTLILSVNHPIDPQKEALHMRYYPKEDLWSFVYYSAPFSLTRFSRTYPGEQGIENFISLFIGYAGS